MTRMTTTQDNRPASSAGTQSSAAAVRRRRWRWLAVAGGAFALIGVVYGAYWEAVLRHQQSTDDAYVNGNVVQITPQISGTVVSIGADDTQFVKAGKPLGRRRQGDGEGAF